jgi:hypothetical protein
MSGDSPFAPGFQPPQFRCPFCGSGVPPIRSRKITTAGLVLFIVLFLFLCWPLCWIGLLITEDDVKCTTCGMTL